MPLEKRQIKDEKGLFTGSLPKYSADELVIHIAGYIDGGWKELGNTIPSNAGFCADLGIAKSTLLLRAKEADSNALSELINVLATAQESVALDGGLNGDLAPTIVKLILANHGYSDRIDQQITGKDGGPIATQEVTPEDMRNARAEMLAKDDV